MISSRSFWRKIISVMESALKTDTRQYCDLYRSLRLEISKDCVEKRGVAITLGVTSQEFEGLKRAVGNRTEGQQFDYKGIRWLVWNGDLAPLSHTISECRQILEWQTPH